jgi:glycosyltransferase involved in cell wall biosynthesis
MTDNPENLAKVHPIYVSAAKKALKGSTALLTLSSGLLTALNATEKPHFIFPGIVEKMPEGKPLFTPRSYFYFGGALLRRYGIEDLLKAYLACLPDYDLILAGHESMDDSLNHLLHSNPRIHFLGQVTKEENYNLEKNAALLINPRPFDSKLDQESIPSKLLEYLESSAPIVSTPHTFLQKEFPNDINWLKGSGESVLTDFLKSHLDAEKKLTGILPNEAAEKLYATYGVEAVGASLQSFLSSLKA